MPNIGQEVAIATSPYSPPNLSAVREQARSIDTGLILEGATEIPLDSRAAATLAIWEDESICDEELIGSAARIVAERAPRLHTFVPLYTTNHCDAECKMCAMRKGNRRLVRKFSTRSEIEDQLSILYENEGVRGVGLLTGEYEDEHSRLASAFRIGWAARTALDRGFERVYINIGSMTSDEVEMLGDWLETEEPVTMCVFQETYDRSSFERFMGEEGSSPKADYRRRLESFDRWIDGGFGYVNPGVLVGLHDDLAEEMVHLVSHASHLQSRGAVVDLSLPRLRPAMGTGNAARVQDAAYLRMMAAIALVCRDQRLVLTTRESMEFQNIALDLAGVISPGSPDVAPYRRSGQASNAEETSQFKIADLRRPSEILSGIESQGIEVDHFRNLDNGALSLESAF